MTNCAARIRPLPDPIVLECELKGKHDEHSSTLKDYAYPGSRTIITWQETDRRNFTGEWFECAKGNCVLPNGHRGECAP